MRLLLVLLGATGHDRSSRSHLCRLRLWRIDPENNPRLRDPQSLNHHGLRSKVSRPCDEILLLPTILYGIA